MKALTWFVSIAIFICMPFVYTIFLQDVEQSPRFLFLSVLALVAGVVLFVNRDKIYGIGKDKIYVIVLLFIFWNFIGMWRSNSFGDGLFEFLRVTNTWCWFVIFLVTINQDIRNIQVYLKCIVLSAVIFIGIEAAKHINVNKIFRIDYSIASSLGNKNFFSETLLLFLPFTIACGFYQQRFWKYTGYAVSLLIFVTTIFLQTLSTWVAMGAAVLALGVVITMYFKIIFTTPKLQQCTTVVSVLAVLISGSSIFALYKTGKFHALGPRIETVKKMISDGDVNEITNQNSTYERIILWRNSVKMIVDNPFAGVGTGNWKILFATYGLGNAPYMTTGAVRFIHPHNDYLYIASEGGIIYLLVFTGIFVWILFYAVTMMKTITHKLLLVACITGIVMYMTIAMVSLPGSRIYAPLLLMLMFAIVLSLRRSMTNAPAYGKKIMVTIIATFILLSSISTYIGIVRIQADSLVTAALQQEMRNNWTMMRKKLEKINRVIYPMDVNATPVAWYLGFASFYLNDVNTAFDYFKEAEKVNPTHLMVLNDLGTAYNLSGDTKSAIAYYEKALAIQPYFGDALINLSIVYYNEGNLDKAYQVVTKFRGKMKQASIPVFATILEAKAMQLPGMNEQKLEKFRKRLGNTATISEFLSELRSAGGNLEEVTDGH